MKGSRDRGTKGSSGWAQGLTLLACVCVALGSLLCGGCAVVDNAHERSWTVGPRDKPVAQWKLTASEAELATTGTFNPFNAVPALIGEVRGWFKG